MGVFFVTDLYPLESVSDLEASGDVKVKSEFSKHWPRKIRKHSPPEGRSVESPVPLPSFLGLWREELSSHCLLEIGILRGPWNFRSPGSPTRAKGRLSHS